MAVDTAQKRFSMMSFGDGGVLHVLFEADGSVDLDDRTHLLGLYSGIVITPPPPSVLAKFASSRSRMLTLTRGP